MVPPRVRRAVITSGQNVGTTGQDNLRIAAFGDSVMWGQGLERQERFTALFAAAMQSEIGKPGVVIWDESRSGAKIREQDPERDNFVDTYPFYFPTAASVRAFHNGNELGATALYGEEPATFPTIRGQVSMLPSSFGKNVDVALVNGGANDVGIEDIIDPRVAPGEYIERFDGQIRAIGMNSVQLLLSDVRRKCPNAVILYFGLFMTASYKTSTSKLKAFFKHEFDSDVGWWLNKHVLHDVDVNKLLRDAMIRSIWFQGRWQYWTRQAVDAIVADDSLRGPGVVYVPSTFTEDNAGFADQSFIWEDYTDPTEDPAQVLRAGYIPRHDLYNAMVNVRGSTYSRDDGVAHNSRGFTDLLAALDGPLTLKRNLQDYIDGREGAGQMLLDSLGEEIHRIQHARIASFGHPNQLGAKAYADEAIRRFREHRATVAQVAKESRPGAPGPAPGGVQTLDAILRHYGLRTPRVLAADVGHLDVDSVAIRVKTAANSSRNLGEAVWLFIRTLDASGVAGIRRYLLTFLTYVNPRTISAANGDPIGKEYPHFEPNATNRFTVDTMGRLRLDEIVSCALAMGPDPFAGNKALQKWYGVDWYPETVTLEVNGVQVRELDLFGSHFGPGDQIDLQYPTPQPQQSPLPKLALPRIARVREFPQSAESAKRLGQKGL